jgi:ABC-type branched-subunit amino acid transport system ATPase component
VTAGDDIVLRTEALEKSFGSLTVAHDISIALPRGARYALIGPNGAGKTTLINLITGQLAPDSGRIELGGKDITRTPAAARVRQGLARTFQINTLFPDLTPIEAVTLAICERERSAGQFWRGLTAHKAAIDEAQEILNRLGLGDVTTQTTRTLPYGKQRLLEIAVAIATGPRVLLLDEPAAGVPESERHDILAAVASLPRDVTVLLIEHDMDLVFSFADRISVMVAGSILVEGTPDEVARDPRVKAVYLGEGADA